MLAGSAYLLASVWLYRSQRRMLYFPQPLLTRPRAQSFAIESNGVTRHGWIINPGREQALLYFGGNRESVEQNEELFARALPRASIYLIPYRGFSGNPGSPSEQALFADALADYDYVAARHPVVDVMGRSLGSGVAVYVAVNRPVSRLVLTTPYDSIQSLAQEKYPLFPMRLILEDKFDSSRRVPSLTAKTLVLVADHDLVVPRASTDRLISKFRVPPAVTVIGHSDHSTIIHKPDYARAIRSFLKRRSRRKNRAVNLTSDKEARSSASEHADAIGSLFVADG
jgi:pimeloyl-ACP methyl ester carboxylesterase